MRKIKVKCRETTRVDSGVRQAVEPLDHEFVEEWMEEQGVRRGDEWLEMVPGYEREFCEVRLKDKTVIGPCWPNAGKFMRLDGGTETLESEVTHIRYFVNAHPEGDDDGFEAEDAAEDEVTRGY